MFEFILAFSKKNIGSLPDFSFYDPTIHERHEISHKDFKVNFLSYKMNSNNDFYEDKSKIIIIYGSIFSSIDSKLPGQISAEYLSLHDNLLSKPEKYLRGNYAIIWYNKISNTLKVILDPLGLKPIYLFEQECCKYLSSSLWLLSKISKTLDYNSIAESIFFGYNITNKTIFKNIYQLENGTELIIENDKINTNKYFSIIQFISTKPSKYSYEELRIIFNNVVLKRINEKNSEKDIIVTLTGGYDGRAVLSSVYYCGRNFKTFSFGMKNGENTLIPELIANKLGFEHHSIYLEDSFIKEYFNNAISTLILSDGNLSFEQQSTLYTFKKLKFFLSNSILLTGLLAGEILGPIHLKHDYFNEHYFNLVLNNEDLNENYLEIHDDLKIIGKEFFKKHNDYLIHIINERKKQLSEIINQKQISHLNYYLDLINLGFRKFYGMQMHLQRFYAENLPVFYDLDILKYILITNYHNRFKNSFKSLYHRWQSRIPQAYIACKNYPPLGKIILDRGFTPEYLLNPIKKYLTILPYLKRKYATKTLHPDFDSPNWCLNYLKHFNFDELKDAYLDTTKMKKYIKNLEKNKKLYNPEINKIISTISFLKLINK